MPWVLEIRRACEIPKHHVINRLSLRKCWSKSNLYTCYTPRQYTESMGEIHHYVVHWHPIWLDTENVQKYSPALEIFRALLELWIPILTSQSHIMYSQYFESHILCERLMVLNTFRVVYGIDRERSECNVAYALVPTISSTFVHLIKQKQYTFWEKI